MRGRFVINVAHFVGIENEVEAFPFFRGREVNEFVGLGANAVLLAGVVVAGFVVVAIVKTFAPVARLRASEDREHAAALDVGKSLRGAGKFEEGGCEIAIDGDGVGDRAGLDVAGPARDERHANRFLIHEAFVEHAVIAEEKSLVARVNDDGVFFEIVVGEIF